MQIKGYIKPKSVFSVLPSVRDFRWNYEIRCNWKEYCCTQICLRCWWLWWCELECSTSGTLFSISLLYYFFCYIPTRHGRFAVFFHTSHTICATVLYLVWTARSLPSKKSPFWQETYPYWKRQKTFEKEFLSISIQISSSGTKSLER